MILNEEDKASENEEELEDEETEETEENEEEEEDEENGEDEKDKTINALTRKVDKLVKKYEKATKRIDVLTQKKISEKPLTDEEKKELEAQKYIKKMALEAFQEVENEKKTRESEEFEKFETELEEIVDKGEFGEDDILEICEKAKVMPKVAETILKMSQEKSKKPKLPNPQRGAIKIDDSLTEIKGKANMSFEEKMASIAKEIKSKITN